MEIAISEFKAKCLQLLKQTSDSGEELVVTLRGKPLARVSGIPQGGRRVLGGQPRVISAGAEDDVLIRSDFESDWES